MNLSPTDRDAGHEADSNSQTPLNADSPAARSVYQGSSRSATAKGSGRQITRNRASYSCHTCRRRKVKCDKVHPTCGNCLKTGNECSYDAMPKEDSRGHNNKEGHGVKRRRETSRPVDDDIDDLQSVYSNLKQAWSSEEQKSAPQGIEARLDKLTSMIERLSRTNQPLDPAERQLLAQNASVEAAKRDGRSAYGHSLPLTSAGSSRPDSPRRAADSSGDEFPIPSGHATDLVDPIGSLNLGHLSLEDGGRSRYVGTTYWAYISNEINELNQLLRDQNRSHNDSTVNEGSVEESMPDSMVRTPASQWKLDDSPGTADGRTTTGEAFQRSVLFPSSESPSVLGKIVEPEMLDHVPTKRQSHILYQGFMSGIHAISPVIHPPTILKLYNAFWNWYDYSSYSGEPFQDPSFIPLLYAIWYGGSITVSIRTIKAEFNIASRSALSKTFNEEVTRWLTKISFPRSPSLQGLAAYLLVQTILSKEEEPLTSSLFVSLAMRVAQTMGLHRDPAKFGIQAYEAEYRRRIWWHIVHMDGVVAMSSGLPPLVSDENFWDVREASEVKDTLLGTPQAETYERMVASGMRPPDNPDDPTVCGGPSTVNVYYLSARGKYVMACAVRRILRIQLGIKPITRRDMEELRTILLDLQLQLNSIINRIPEARTSFSRDRACSFSQSPVEIRTSDTELPGKGPASCLEQYHTPVLVSFHKWARILLSLFIDKAFCVAYQPFLKNAKSRIWPAARQSALRHCHGFMEKFISLATDPEFQPFHWSWPGNHQPMHAAMIMLIDLHERPSSPEAPKSRAFIDKIFSLTGPDGGVVGGEDGISTQRPLKDGGREAWDMIRRLRHNAWQKAGLDPQKLWTEQAQVQAGVAPAPDEYPCASDPYYANNAGSSPVASLTSRRQLSDFSKMFYNMTRSHVLPNPASTLRPSPLRNELPPPPTNPTPAPVPVPATPPTASSTSTPHFPQTPTTTSRSIDNILTTSPLHSQPLPSSINNNTAPIQSQYPSANAPSPSPSLLPSFLPTSPSNNNPPIPSVPTPPSMVDPNLNFDWDQWDAVFGQHLPVADELMELDPVSGFEFGDLGGMQGGNRSNQSQSQAGSETAMDDVRGPDWYGYC